MRTVGMVSPAALGDLYTSMVTMPVDAVTQAHVGVRDAAHHRPGTVIYYTSGVPISARCGAPMLPFMLIATVMNPGVVRFVVIFGKTLVRCP